MIDGCIDASSGLDHSCLAVQRHHLAVGLYEPQAVSCKTPDLDRLMP